MRMPIALIRISCWNSKRRASGMVSILAITKAPARARDERPCSREPPRGETRDARARARGTVDFVQAWLARCMLQVGQLLAKGEVLDDQLGARTGGETKRCKRLLCRWRRQPFQTEPCCKLGLLEFSVRSCNNDEIAEKVPPRATSQFERSHPSPAISYSTTSSVGNWRCPSKTVRIWTPFG